MTFVEIDLRKIFDLSALLQNAFITLLFAILVWIGRIGRNAIQALWKKSRIQRHRNDIVKIILHQQYIKRNGLYYFSQGYLLVMFKSGYHMVKGLIFYFFFYSADVVANRLGFLTFDIMLFFGLYLCTQQLISAYSWLDPKWANAKLEKYDPNLVKEVVNEFKTSDAMKGDN